MGVVRLSLIAAATLAAACGPSRPGNGSSDADAATATSVDTGSSADTSEASTSAGSSTSGSSTSESSTTTQNTETSSTTEAGFVQEDVPLEPCNAHLQDCAEGEKCTAYVDEPGYCCVDSTACVPVTGDLQYGEACTREAMNDDCAAGLFCMAFPTSGDAGPGVCLEICGADFTCPDQDFCLVTSGVLPICLDWCDPLSAGDCGSASLVCAPAGTSTPEGVPAWACRPLGEPAAPGSPCTNWCEPGSTCVDAAQLNDPLCPPGSDKCCANLCDLSAPGNCGAPHQCTPWATVSGQANANEAPWEQVGACVL